MKPLTKEEREELERFIRGFPFTNTARAIKSALVENDSLKSAVEDIQKTLEQIANTEWHPNADLVNVEIAYEMRALAKEALQSLNEDKP